MSEPLKILVVDDEPLARQRLLRLLQAINPEYNLFTADCAATALELVLQQQPQLLLVDMRMPDGDGLTLAQAVRQLPYSPAVVFTTAYSEYALDAFAVEALDYLLKPVRQEQLVRVIARVTEQLALTELESTVATEPEASLMVRLHGQQQLIPLSQILYFRSDHKYVTAYVMDSEGTNYQPRERIIDETLKDLEERYPDLI
ncbi:MAG: response regulator transcription factor, partial [Gammaproteobacteria bacterium]|nr:response regulator transcription factor [Gammaproteobacteria bacterium]